MTKTIYLGQYDQHCLEVEFDIEREDADPDSGLMTDHYSIVDCKVLSFNASPREGNEEYFRWLDKLAEDRLDDSIPEMIEEEMKY